MSSSSDEIDSTKLQCEEEQCHQEAENRIWEAEAKKAEDEEKKRRAAEEAHRKVEEEAEEEAKKRAKEERKKSQSMEADKTKRTPGALVIHPQETEAIMTAVHPGHDGCAVRQHSGRASIGSWMRMGHPGCEVKQCSGWAGYRMGRVRILDEKGASWMRGMRGMESGMRGVHLRHEGCAGMESTECKVMHERGVECARLGSGTHPWHKRYRVRQCGSRASTGDAHGVHAVSNGLIPSSWSIVTLVEHTSVAPCNTNICWMQQLDPMICETGTDWLKLGILK
ncbi:hypothetical protein BDN67DRAFT_982219 [Paxillus ammoniavirescens]|nr:hypothetical protein BDN67DRAFT_982219 [Paxillus ammoniavirescens]